MQIILHHKLQIVLSIVIDKPLVNCIPFVIKDTKGFLRKWRGLIFVQDTALIGPINVVGLYPYISHCEGLEARRKAMEKENPKVPVRNL